jgi:hypothetical protein
MVVIIDSFCQRIRTLGLILWIDSNTFATALLEKVFKKEDTPFYTLADAKDFSYLFEDLRPTLLVLDAATALHSLDAFRRQYEGSEIIRKVPVVVIDNLEGLEFITNVVGHLQRPFDPFIIPAFLKGFNSH